MSNKDNYTPELVLPENYKTTQFPIQNLSNRFLENVKLNNSHNDVNFKEGYFEININNIKYIVTNNYAYKKYFIHQEKNMEQKILHVTNSLFFKILEKVTSEKNIKESVNSLINKNHNKNAFIFNSFFVRLFIVSIFLSFLIFVSYSKDNFYILNIIFFVQIIFKFLIFSFSLFRKEKKFKYIKDSDLPVYTILVPLYKEAARIPKIYEALNSLNYPKDKLDIKIILEEDDTQTRKAVFLQSFPDIYHVLIVPNSDPKTKPKACNYAMKYAMGKYCVIYDAEDVPEKNQLKKAVARFKELPESFCCLQARLKIIPKKSLLLGNLFMLEYDMWFQYLINGVANLHLPIPLGGTSNHFKTKILDKIGGWDPFNVTEDADIGIRLDREGYRVGMLDSETKEEGPISIKSWIKQRVRWIKGYIITYVISVVYLKSDRNFIGFVSTTMLLGFASFTFLSLPILILHGVLFGIANDMIMIFSVGNLVLYMVFFWSVAYLLVKTNQIEKNIYGLISLIIFPAYFFLHSISSYLAIIEMFWKPFRWNKTDHSY